MGQSARGLATGSLKRLQFELHDQTGGFSPPVFFGRSFFNLFFCRLNGGLLANVSFQQIVEQTVSGLGYDLVEIERSAGGLVRITIDLPWTLEMRGQTAQFITVEDCEKVNRQLQYALEVENVEYRRLEISSPGLDRPLRSELDFERFEGEVIDITLKAPMGEAAGGLVNANRKKFRGTLERTEAGGWQIVWREELKVKPGQKVSKKRELPPLQALGFVLDELRDARLAPIVDFKGRGVAPGAL